MCWGNMDISLRMCTCYVASSPQGPQDQSYFVSEAPNHVQYQMSHIELTELKIQSQDMLAKGLVQPSP
eukprot:c3267_g1_i1 orf=49-252(+)